ncbi:hypothetical protein R5W24_003333 [Gemmata sp. JC717]|uniref:hypothetical protein n=1 Tax=Gemmata algarum TaxID=2975278 RepID=UPI0021BB709D|nr:hypothetical protein [Gemmata algarum]MDY3554214.1 hypothetical protein [Gemmata algarum]
MLDAVSPTIMTELTSRLIGLCRSDDGKIALQALELFLNRILGKPKESIELDVTSIDSPVMPSKLDAADLAALERMRRKLQADNDVIDAEVIDVTPTNGKL